MWSRTTRAATVLIALVAAAASLAASYEAYYLHLGNRPSEGNPGWHEDAQGLAHDDNHWFITQTTKIWKIPVEHDLSVNANGAPGVLTASLSDYPQLAAYNHLGDPVHFYYQGVGYLLVPLEGESTPPALAVFRGSNLDYLDHVTMPDLPKFGWCAIDRSGALYTSDFHNMTFFHYTTAFLRYTIDWEHFSQEHELTVTSGPVVIEFHTSSGERLELHHAQGGEFSPSGDLLYFVTGYYEDTSDFGEGLHVFDTTTWRRIQHSTNGFGYFNYQFDSGFATYEEPEGLTVWDLEDGRAPNVRGQLHVMLLDNDETDADDIYVKHYTRIIRVDALHSGSEYGTPSEPYRTVLAALDLAWDGSEIRIRAGVYLEPMVVSTRVRFTAEGGAVRIGG